MHCGVRGFKICWFRNSIERIKGYTLFITTISILHLEDCFPSVCNHPQHNSDLHQAHLKSSLKKKGSTTLVRVSDHVGLIMSF